MCAFKVHIWQKNHRIVGQFFFNMYFEVFSEIRFRKHPSQCSLYFNGAEYFYRQSWSSNYLFLRVCVLYVLYDSWVSTDLSVSIKTTTTTTTTTTVINYIKTWSRLHGVREKYNNYM